MTYKGQKLGKAIVGMTFLCLVLYHKQNVQGQAYTQAFQIPRAQVHSHALKIVNPVYLAAEFLLLPSLQ